MTDLESYVDSLFQKYRYRQTPEIAELRQEVLSDLEARVVEMTGQGMSYIQAVDEAIKTPMNIAALVGGNRTIPINRFKMELSQWMMIYLLCGWIASILLMVFPVGRLIYAAMTVAVVLSGIFYLYMYIRCKDHEYFEKLGSVNRKKLNQARIVIWWGWGFVLFLIWMAIICLSVLTSYFTIELNQLLFMFLVSLLTVILPLTVSCAYRLSAKYEVLL